MSKNEIMDNFLLNYGWTPTLEEKNHFERFCDGIATQEMLEKVLDPANHPAFESGRRSRPNIATLYSIKDSMIRAEYNLEPPLPVDQYVYERPKCLLCIEGETWDFVWRDKWVTEYIGPCKFCLEGDSEPSPEIIRIIESTNVPLPSLLLEFSIRLLESKMGTGHLYFEVFPKVMKHLAPAPESPGSHTF